MELPAEALESAAIDPSRVTARLLGLYRYDLLRGWKLMRIGIISDTHDQVARTGRAVAILRSAGAEALFHCGDVTVPDVVFECAGLPSFFVHGNCDLDLNGLRDAIDAIEGTCLDHGGLVTLADRHIAVTHGDSEREVRRLMSLGPHYLFSGHSHRLADLRVAGVRRINPGALSRAASWTVALLDLLSDDLQILQVNDER